MNAQKRKEKELNVKFLWLNCKNALQELMKQKIKQLKKLWKQLGKNQMIKEKQFALMKKKVNKTKKIKH